MAKTASKIINLLLVFYLITFPFGQLAVFTLLGYKLLFADIIVLMIAIVHFIRLKGRVFNYFILFIVYAVFSCLLSLYIFSFQSLLGLLYLLRLIAYLILLDAVWYQVQNKKISSDRIFNLLVYFATLTAIIGLIQYLILPDLRFLFNFGWDRHYGRLAGLYLDPAFIGLIIVLNLILIIHLIFQKLQHKFILVGVINLITLLLTFSRASYLAMIMSFIYITKTKIKFKKILIIIGLFIISLNFLPKFQSEGTNLLRTFSIYARFDDYKSSLKVISASPVIGVGFNNLCEFKSRINEDVYYSNTCSGFDSSLLMLIATTGLAGTVLFFHSFVRITQNIRDSKKNLVYASYIAVLLHSMFSNSMFYPWVMGWMLILIPASMKVRE